MLAQATPTLADIDRELVAREGLRRFIKLAWPLVEPRTLLWNWHIDAMAEHLEAVLTLQIRNLLLLVPPGAMKTLSASVFFPAYGWIDDPGLKFITASYAQDVSDKSAVQHRDLVASEWYRERWGERLDKATSKRVRYFTTSQKGFRFSTSVGGIATGYHGDVLMFDDLLKAQDAEGRAKALDTAALIKANEFWTKTMPTREADPNTTRRIGIMQRLHHNDPAAECIKSGEYEVLKLPMEFSRKHVMAPTKLGFTDPRKSDGDLLWPERWDAETVAKKRRTLGARAAAAQYDQNPTPPGGLLFLKKYWRHWGHPGSKFPELPTKAVQYLQSWDCSFKNLDTSDWVVGQVWLKHFQDLFLVHQVRGKWGLIRTVAEVEEMSEMYPQALIKLIEDKANGSGVIETLEGKIAGIVGINPTESKEARASLASLVFEARNVWIPHESRADWVEEYKAEMEQFNMGPFDDQVDCTTQAVNYWTQNESETYRQAMANLREAG